MQWFNGINFTAVAVAALMGSALGALWYSSALFGYVWMRETGRTKEDVISPLRPAVFSFAGTLIAAFGLEFLVIYLDVTQTTGGLKLGLLAGACFSASALFSDRAYNRRSAALFAIQAGYQTVCMIVMAVILSAWR